MAPDWDRFREWLIASDGLLERVWGRMDRYHLVWLNVGRDSAPPGSSLDEEGTRRFIGEVASGKLAVLRTMRSAVARQGWVLLADDDVHEEDALAFASPPAAWPRSSRIPMTRSLPRRFWPMRRSSPARSFESSPRRKARAGIPIRQFRDLRNSASFAKRKRSSIPSRSASRITKSGAFPTAS